MNLNNLYLNTQNPLQNNHIIEFHIHKIKLTKDVEITDNYYNCITRCSCTIYSSLI